MLRWKLCAAKLKQNSIKRKKLPQLTLIEASSYEYALSLYLSKISLTL